ncbi:hypothetical protein [Salinisphaera hydrothermalis]|uniref:Uncharacterized protein n=1 Tax=Salinisphaera hydrothermalis (strain C41B8) TaxID=1304275 RepID=A0A084INN2_SALHC|nr:hypothetical protein [Salinisphaera hydrothermalis]KEZ78316.1 hypothetical protein C41B8_05423 [Salinisphaera hydrothermalis C41B8]
MATGNDDDRYEHQFEDLNGNPDDTTTDVDLGDDQDFELGGDDQAPRDAAGDQDDDDGGDGQPDQQAQGSDNDAGGEQAGDEETDEQREARLNAEIDQALEAERTAARDQELESLRDEIRQLREERAQAQAQGETEQLDRDIESTRQKMVSAQEEGDTAAAAEAQNKLVELQVRKHTSASRADPGDGGDQGQPGRQRQAPAEQVPAAAQRWVGRHPWFAQGTNAQAAQTALVIEKRLRGAGFDPNSDAMYDEIDRQLSRRHPELGITPRDSSNQGDHNQNGSRNGSRRRGAPTNGMGAQGKASSGKVQITADDRASMSQFGLDPDNKEHLKIWAREKRASQQNAQRR